MLKSSLQHQQFEHVYTYTVRQPKYGIMFTTHVRKLAKKTDFVLIVTSMLQYVINSSLTAAVGVG